LPLFFTDDEGQADTATLFDYLAPGALTVLSEGVHEAATAFWQQTGERYAQRRHDIERPLLAPAELFLSPDELRTCLNRGLRIDVSAEDGAALGDQPAPR